MKIELCFRDYVQVIHKVRESVIRSETLPTTENTNVGQKHFTSISLDLSMGLILVNLKAMQYVNNIPLGIRTCDLSVCKLSPQNEKYTRTRITLQ